MSDPHGLPGVLAGVGPARHSDLNAFRQGRLRLVRLRAQVNPIGDLAKWRDAGAAEAILSLLSPLPAQHPTSPERFVEVFAADIEAFLKAGGRYLEVHDEPNRSDRGAGVTWQDGAGFAAWFHAVSHLIRGKFGDTPRVGFPALTPASSRRPDPSAAVDEGTFLEQCRDALELADWAALHVYWRTLEEMRGSGAGMRFLATYLEAFPEQVFIVTEFANASLDLAPGPRGDQYAEFVTLLAQYDRILGASGFLLRSADPHYDPLAWIANDGTPRATIAHLGRRPELPDPRQVWFDWPTGFRAYDQLFGDHQRAHHDGFGIVGGHNGVDLAVDRDAPEASPIHAALGGTVVQVALDQSGYGQHVRVRSYGPQGEEITLLYGHLSGIEVTTGTLVARGDVLGWAGPATHRSGPHLHFGMRVTGVDLPVTFDWLNPRPYLEARPRVLPR